VCVLRRELAWRRYAAARSVFSRVKEVCASEARRASCVRSVRARGAKAFVADYAPVVEGRRRRQ